MERKNCTHQSDFVNVMIVRWCARCSGWHFSRLGVPCGSSWASGSLELLESHFLPVEETGPDEISPVVNRAFHASAEMALPERRY